MAAPKKAVFVVDILSDVVHFFGFAEPQEDVDALARNIQNASPGALVYSNNVDLNGNDPDAVILARTRLILPRP